VDPRLRGDDTEKYLFDILARQPHFAEALFEFVGQQWLAEEIFGDAARVFLVRDFDGFVPVLDSGSPTLDPRVEPGDDDGGCVESNRSILLTKS